MVITSEVHDYSLLLTLSVLISPSLSPTGFTVLGSSSPDLRGKNFVFAFPPNLNPNDNVFQLVLTPCDISVTRTIVNISTPSHQLNYFSTHILMTSYHNGRSTPGVYDDGLTVILPKEIAEDRDEFFIDGTILVTSDNDITVVAVSGQTRTLATFPVIPTVSLGYEYVIVTYANPRQPNTLPAEFVISSIHHNKTQVRIQLTGDALPSTDWSMQYSASEEFTIDLFSYDSVLFRSSEGLTGSRIWSDQPISVVSGSACIFIPKDVLACDHIVEHLPPVNRWGRRYIIPPFLGRRSGYVYRVVAARHSTRVTYTDVESSTVTLDEGEYLERNVDTGDASLIVADKPVLVAQYSKGNFTDGAGDPAMVLITPVEQYVTEVTFTNFNVSAYSVANEYLSIITLCDDVDKILLNGSPLIDSVDSSVSLTLDDFCMLRKQLSIHMIHTISTGNEDGGAVSQARFAAFQYGFGIRVAYAHPVGFGLRELTCLDEHGEEESCKPPGKLR